MSWTLSLTIHLWWLGAYLAVGVALYAPLNYLAWRHIHAARPWWPFLWLQIKHHHGLDLLVQVVAWPVSVWEEIR